MTRSDDDPYRGHRRAARPRWTFPKGAFVNEDLDWLGTAPAFSTTGLQTGPSQDIRSVLQPIPAPGVDPSVSAVAQILADMEYVVGRSPAMLGAPGRGAANAASTSDPTPSQAFDPARPHYVAPEGGLWDDCVCHAVVGRHAVSGKAYYRWTDEHSFASGNMMFFDPDDTARMRLRPLMRGDMAEPEWFAHDANSLLWVDSPNGNHVTIFVVSLFPRGALTSPSTIARAVQYARREYGTDFPDAVAALAHLRAVDDL